MLTMARAVIVRGGQHARRRISLSLEFEEKHARPRYRSDCLPGGFNETRPCPFVGCRHHLALEVAPSGALIDLLGVESDDFDWDGLDDTCSLDVAERGGLSLSQIAVKLRLTHQRVQQVEWHAVSRIREQLPPIEWRTDDEVDD